MALPDGTTEGYRRKIVNGKILSGKLEGGADILSEETKEEIASKIEAHGMTQAEMETKEREAQMNYDSLSMRETVVQTNNP